MALSRELHKRIATLERNYFTNDETAAAPASGKKEAGKQRTDLKQKLRAEFEKTSEVGGEHTALLFRYLRGDP
jgi:hypothetical protein